MPLKRLAKLNTKDCLWVYVLKILENKPMHGYALRKEIETKFGFRPGMVTAYKVLYSLKKNGYVEAAAKERINVYKITAKGKILLKKAIEFYEDRAKILK
jgi:DNA-binding PadR family transcriptional regulator